MTESNGMGLSIDCGPGCKICGRSPAESYRKAMRPGTRFTCQRCLNDGIVVSAAPKKDLERLYARSAFIAEVWDADNSHAVYLMDLARKKLDPRLCIRIRDQVSNLKLRRRWLKARVNGDHLPRVAPAVKWHFEQEFQRTYPLGVRDIETDPIQMPEYQGSFASKTVDEGGSMDTPILN